MTESELKILDYQLKLDEAIKKYDAFMKNAFFDELDGEKLHEVNNLLTPILGFAQLLRIKGKESPLVLTLLKNKEIIEQKKTFESCTKKTVNIQDLVQESMTSLAISGDVKNSSSMSKDKFEYAETKLNEESFFVAFKEIYDVIGSNFDVVFGEQQINNISYCSLTFKGGYTLDFNERILLGNSFDPVKESEISKLYLTKCVAKCNDGHLKITDEGKLEMLLPIHEARYALGTDIVVVDDDETIGSLMEEVISTLGYENAKFFIDKKTAAQSALKHLEEITGNVQLIISDVIMPGMDGIEFYKKVKKQHPDIPFVFMTGCPGYDNKDFKSLIQSGVPCIYKPFKLKELQKILAEYVIIL